MRPVLTALLLGLVVVAPVFAQEPALSGPTPSNCPDQQLCPVSQPIATSEPQAAPCENVSPPPEAPWRTAWGLVGLRIIPDGLKTAPNGMQYHPNFSIDANLNCWVWQRAGLYLFSDIRFWGEKSEYDVTNGRDGFFGTSKRQFDLSGGAACNYYGNWEARVWGYSFSNLNRGISLVQPTGFLDGSVVENRYYLSPEYARLGQTGFDVARATFLSAGYYLSKNLVGNDGQAFTPGWMLRGYLTWDLGSWPTYLFGDATCISDRSWQPKLIYFDLGLAVRPFPSHRQWEFRLGAENTGDFQVGNVQSLGYASVRFIF